MIQASNNGSCKVTRHLQQKMHDLFYGFEFIPAYIDDLLMLTKGDRTDHIHNLELTLNKLKGKGLNFNIEKSFFRKNEMEYLGFWITRDDIKLINKKTEAMTNMSPHTSRKEVQNLLGVMNYYRDIWSRRSHMLVPLTKLMSIKENTN